LVEVAVAGEEEAAAFGAAVVEAASAEEAGLLR
jgi:hypothetical protein